MKKFLIVILLLFVAGCSGKYAKPFQDTWKSGDTAKMETEVVEDMVGAIEDDSVEETDLSRKGVTKSVFEDVLFDFDKYIIKDDARPVLNDVASFLKKNRKLNIIIEGHCDEKGTNEYNLALGEKRAKATKQYIASLGVSPARMMIVTYGEEKPLCVRQNETCWEKNRRAHFVVIKKEVFSELIQQYNIPWDDMN